MILFNVQKNMTSVWTGARAGTLTWGIGAQDWSSSKAWAESRHGAWDGAWAGAWVWANIRLHNDTI
jgi:hypothetical protein